MSFVNMKNCIRFYQTAEEIQAELLKNHCSELISNHWVSWKRVKKKDREEFCSRSVVLILSLKSSDMF